MLSVKIKTRLLQHAKSSPAELSAAVTKKIVQAALRAGEMLVGAIRAEIKNWVSATEGVKTGALMRSFRVALARVTKDEVVVVVWSDSKYARIHEEGGTILPKNVSMLAIPLTNQARRYIRPREFPGLILIKSRRGNTILAQVTGKGKLRPQYVLKESVYIRPKRYISKAIAVADPDVRAAVERASRIAAEFLLGRGASDAFSNFSADPFSKFKGDGNAE